MSDTSRSQNCTLRERIRSPEAWAFALIISTTVALLLALVVHAVNISPYDIYILGAGRYLVIGGGVLVSLLFYAQGTMALAPSLVFGLVAALTIWLCIRVVNLSHYDVYILGYGQPLLVFGGLALTMLLYVRASP